MSTIAKRLLDFARRIGRWLLERLARRGAVKVIGYLLGKVDDFERRKAGAAKRGNLRRVSWLTGRISRWKAAAAWLAKHEASVGTVIDEACKAATAANIPVCSANEREPRVVKAAAA